MSFLTNFAMHNSFMGLKLQFHTSVTFKYNMKVKENDQRPQWKASFLLIA